MSPKPVMPALASSVRLFSMNISPQKCSMSLLHASCSSKFSSVLNLHMLLLFFRLFRAKCFMRLFFAFIQDSHLSASPRCYATLLVSTLRLPRTSSPRLPLYPVSSTTRVPRSSFSIFQGMLASMKHFALLFVVASTAIHSKPGALPPNNF